MGFIHWVFIYTLKAQGVGVSVVAISPDSQLLASGVRMAVLNCGI
jgi:hypothetical protein